MKRKYQVLAEQLEKEGKFTDSVIHPNLKRCKVPDEKYVYQPKNIFFKIFSLIIRFIVWILGPIVNFFMVHLKIKGKQNIKNVKTGAITLCNHVLRNDNPLIVRQAMRTKKFYCTSAPTNCKKGLGGLILKAGGNLPFATSLSAHRNFNECIEKLLQKNCFIGFMPESGLWIGYKKPRPMQRGAFSYACKHNVPIIPTFIEFRKPNRWERLWHRKTLVTLHIGKPIIPNSDLPILDREKKMKETAMEWYASTYKSIYNVEEITYLNGKSYFDYK